MNQVIEFHDSSLLRVGRVGPGISFELQAYVHRSSGRPAVDPGEGWVVPCVVALANVREFAGSTELSGEIWDGSVALSGHVPESVVALPLNHEGACEIEIALVSGDTIRVAGTGLTVASTGAGRFVEPFSGGA